MTNLLTMRRFGNLRSPPEQPLMVAGNHVAFLHDGEASLPAMLAAIAGARDEVLLEMYWFGSDGTGRTFAEALSARAQAGVRVCVSYDSVGSWDSDPGMFARMRAAGCRVYEYNPIRPWQRRFRLGLLNQRNHRKLLVVDGQIGFTGGINFADEWAPFSEGGGGWRDDMVRVEGPAVSDMRAIVLGAFAAAGLDAGSERGLEPPPARGHCPVRVLANDRFRNRRAIENAYLRQIRRAKVSILLANSYFLPRFAVRRALAVAVKRGVEVRVLLPGRSDVPAVAYAMRRLYAWMLERGIHVHEWPHSILHAKSAVVDSRWCTVGTHNLDYRSWQYNLEINVAVEDATAAHALETRLRQDFAESPEVKLSHWNYRPLVERLLEFFFYRFRKLL
ncbi:MAG: phospholipase D-like domain-containing protein [Myxococcales bacterium]|nr:phospholipase D-like domain-containing protein [Myxococcales bacterium]